ncbi:Hypothetical protein POVR2_LOCUS60 [uncultured virus]|nr:Hypothetical protein POVR2_LOCUS60 [uncultured virus]
MNSSKLEGLTSDVLFIVAAHADDSVLEVLSKTPLWDLVYTYLHNQHFWYMRTAAAFNLPEWLTWDLYTREKWSEIYDTLKLDKSGSNPFNEDRHYSSVSIRLLIEMGFDPSVSSNLPLQVAIRHGDVQACRTLLADDRVRISGIGRLVVHSAILSAVKFNKPDLFRLLFENKKTSSLMNEGMVDAIVTSAINADADRIVQLVIEIRDADKQSLEAWMQTAIKLDKPKVVETILTNLNLEHTWQYHYWTQVAIELDSEESLAILLQNDNIGVERALEIASSVGGPKIASLLLENPTITSADVLACIRVAATNQRPLVLTVLLEDDRAKDARRLVAELLSETRNRSVLCSLAKSRQAVFSDLQPETLKRVVDACVDQAEPGLLQQLLLPCYEYSECHYSMLLREIVIKRRDLGYYIDWITEQMKHEDVYINLRRVMISAIDSLQAETIVHTSDIFTAYSGFFLLSQTRSFEKIYNILNSERGRTSHGLTLAIDLVRWFAE